MTTKHEEARRKIVAWTVTLAVIAAVCSVVALGSISTALEFKDPPWDLLNFITSTSDDD